MRSDVKIGLVIAAVFALGLGVWYFAFHSKAGEEVARAPEPVQPANPIVEEGPANNGLPSGYTPSMSTGATTTMPATTLTPTTGMAGLGLPTPPVVPSRLGGGIPAAPILPGSSVVSEPERLYVVKRGDTYASIARKELGNSALAYQIEKANPTVPATKLTAGKTIKIPGKQAPAAPVDTGFGDPGLTSAGTLGGPSDATATGMKTYTVKSGDTGWSIAQSQYGNGALWSLIEKANPGVNAKALRINQKLNIPPRTPAAGSSTGGTAAGGTALGGTSSGDSTDSGNTAVHTAHAATTSASHAKIGTTGAPTASKLPDGRSFD
jgi:nucleoid-associated protein YgaU